MGALGHWNDLNAFAPYSSALFMAGMFFLSYTGLKLTYLRPSHRWKAPPGQAIPVRMRLSKRMALKAVVCWCDAFNRTYGFRPGLYYTGDVYDTEAPLLVTANYLLTVFLVMRKIRKFNVRLLVVDTDGINVWCASSKRQMTDQAILRELSHYKDFLPDQAHPPLVLPKLSLAGVRLSGLREAGIRPLIGPLHVKDLPAYLSEMPLKNRKNERVSFDFRSRFFGWLPSLLQCLVSAIFGFAMLLIIEQLWAIPAPIAVIGLTALLATLYPLLFPYIPGKRFAVKGLWLAAFVSIVIGISAAFGMLTILGAASTIVFVFATTVFIGLSYTGASAVSNYTRVRREVARFLPLNVALYIACAVLFVVKEVVQWSR